MLLLVPELEVVGVIIVGVPEEVEVVGGLWLLDNGWWVVVAGWWVVVNGWCGQMRCLCNTHY